MAMEEWEMVEYVLGVLDEIEELESLGRETCRFVFRSKDQSVPRPVQMLISGSLGGGADVVAIAQVSDEHLNEAVAAAEHVPLAGVATIGDTNWFLKSGTFKTVLDPASLRNHMFVVAMAHNHYTSLVEQKLAAS